MIVDIIKLNSNVEDNIIVDSKVNIPNEYYSQTDIIEIKDMNVYGSFYKDINNDICLYLEINGVITLPCAVSLKPVEVTINTKIDGNLQEMLEEINKNDKKYENAIDILPIIWENILMEIPMRVVSEDIEQIPLKGEGWQLVTEEIPKTNSEFEKLKDLF